MNGGSLAGQQSMAVQSGLSAPVASKPPTPRFVVRSGLVPGRGRRLSHPFDDRRTCRDWLRAYAGLGRIVKLYYRGVTDETGARR